MTELSQPSQPIHISSIFEEMNQLNTVAHKTAVLKKYSDNPFLIYVLKQTYDSFIKYGIKKIPEYTLNKSSSLSIEEQELLIVTTLNNIWEGNVRGNLAIASVHSALNTLDEGYAAVLAGILIKRQPIGIASKTLNQIFGKNFVPLTPYMRCSSSSKMDGFNFNQENYLQIKYDGCFVNLVKDNNGNISILTRNGNELDIYKVYASLELINTTGIVIHGELTLKDGGRNRHISNGLINSLIGRDSTIESINKKLETASEYARSKLQAELATKHIEWNETEQNIQVTVWDIVNYDNWLNGEEKSNYRDRLNNLYSIILKLETLNDNILIAAKTWKISSLQQANVIYKQLLADGEEGAVVKTPTAPWKDHTSTNIIKLKPTYVAEFKVIGFSYGDKNNAFSDVIGNLVAITSDNLLEVKVNGLDYKERGLIKDTETKEWVVDETFDFDAMWMGKIISVKYNGVTRSKTGNIQLEFAQLDKIRYDKYEADTLEYVLDLVD